MFWQGLLDWIFPRVCGSCCNSVIDAEGHLCWDCQAALSFITQPYCSICGDPVEGRIDEEFVCHWCTEHPPGFSRARSAVRYRGVAQTLLRGFKYGRRLWVAEELARILQVCVETHYSDITFDAVVPVPLYPVRRRERGFNQAEVLADLLARDMRKTLIRHQLVRIRHTPSQTHLTARERAFNVRGAFKVRKPEAVHGARLLLIDDVMTTGATVNECARVLKQAGASEVFVATVARG